MTPGPVRTAVVRPMTGARREVGCVTSPGVRPLQRGVRRLVSDVASGKRRAGATKLVCSLVGHSTAQEMGLPPTVQRLPRGDDDGCERTQDRERWRRRSDAEARGGALIWPRLRSLTKPAGAVVLWGSPARARVELSREKTFLYSRPWERVVAVSESESGSKALSWLPSRLTVYELSGVTPALSRITDEDESRLPYARSVV